MWQKIEQQKLITKIYVMKTSTCRVGDGAVGMGGGVGRGGLLNSRSM